MGDVLTMLVNENANNITNDLKKTHFMEFEREFLDLEVWQGKQTVTSRDKTKSAILPSLTSIRPTSHNCHCSGMKQVAVQDRTERISRISQGIKSNAISDADLLSLAVQASAKKKKQTPRKDTSAQKLKGFETCELWYKDAFPHSFGVNTSFIVL